MYKNLVLLDTNKHKEVRILPQKNFSFAKDLISAPITMSEYFEACKSYPIVFAKDKDDQWFSMVLLGLKEQKNLFLNKDMQWKGQHYIPTFIRKHPFFLVKTGKEGGLSVAVESEMLSEGKEGERLFMGDGDETYYLTKMVERLRDEKVDTEKTTAFIKELEGLKILEETSITVKNREGDLVLNGFYRIDEEKLQKITKKAKEKIYTSQLSHYITAHLISLTNIKKLGAM